MKMTACPSTVPARSAQMLGEETHEWWPVAVAAFSSAEDAASNTTGFPRTSADRDMISGCRVVHKSLLASASIWRLLLMVGWALQSTPAPASTNPSPATANPSPATANPSPATANPSPSSQPGPSPAAVPAPVPSPTQARLVESGQSVHCCASITGDRNLIAVQI